MNRIKSIDFVKGICLLTVYIGHCGIKMTYISMFTGALSMPAFFLFSGYLFSYKQSVRKTIVHKIKTLYVVYLIWTIIPFFIISIFDYFNRTITIMYWIKMNVKIILGIELPTQVGQLWFIYALFTTEIIWIIIDQIFKSNKNKYISGLLLGVLGIILNLFNIKIFAFRLETALIMLPVFLFGIFAKQHKTNKCFEFLTNLSPVYIVAACSIWMALCVIHWLIIRTSVSIWLDRYGIFPLFYVTAIIGIIVFVSISKMCLRLSFFPLCLINKIFLFFGMNSTTALVSLNILIFILTNLMNVLPFFKGVNNQITAVIIFILVGIMQVPIARIKKNKYLSVLIGKF